MLLNLLRVEDANPEMMIMQSFHQFQNGTALPRLKQEAAALEGAAAAVSVPHEAEVAEYARASDTLRRVDVELRELVMAPRHSLRFLAPGRLVRVAGGGGGGSGGGGAGGGASGAELEWGWGVVIGYSVGKDAPQSGGNEALRPEDVTVDVLLRCASQAAGKRAAEAAARAKVAQAAAAGGGGSGSGAAGEEAEVSAASKKAAAEARMAATVGEEAAADVGAKVLAEAAALVSSDRKSAAARAAAAAAAAHAALLRGDPAPAGVPAAAAASGLGLGGMPCGPDMEEMRVLPMSLPCLQQLSAVRVYLPKDLRPREARHSVGEALREVARRFPDGLPPLDPVQDMGIRDERLGVLVAQLAELQATLTGCAFTRKCAAFEEEAAAEGGAVAAAASSSSGGGSGLARKKTGSKSAKQSAASAAAALSDLEKKDDAAAAAAAAAALGPSAWYDAYGLKAALLAKALSVRQEIRSTRGMVLKAELKQRKRVLRRLGHANDENVIELKGRSSCEVSTADELLVTELVFGGVFTPLSIPHTIALLASLVQSEKGDEDAVLPPELEGPFRQLQEAATRVAKVMAECKIDIDPDEYAKSFPKVRGGGGGAAAAAAAAVVVATVVIVTAALCRSEAASDEPS
jgi:hypothetical protein